MMAMAMDNEFFMSTSIYFPYWMTQNVAHRYNGKSLLCNVKALALGLQRYYSIDNICKFINVRSFKMKGLLFKFEFDTRWW